MITFVTNNKPTGLDSIPIITEVINLEQYIEGKYYNEYVLLDGFETALFVDTTSKYLDNKVQENIFWYFLEDDFKGTEKSYLLELTEFIFTNIILPERQKLELTIVYDLYQLKEINYKSGLIYSNFREDVLFLLINHQYLYEIDLNYFNFLYNCQCKELISLLEVGGFTTEEIEKFKVVKTYQDVKLHFKTKGLVEKKFHIDQFVEFFKKFKTKTDNNNELYYYLVIFFDKLLSYKKDHILNQEIKISGLNSSNNNIFTYNYVNKHYKNAMKNIFVVEEYLSNIKLKNIELSEYPDLYFPYKSGSVQYTYNGSDSSTGRIFTKSGGIYQSLQTLPKTKKSVVKAEKDCFLIELDYKTFEFNILYQLAGYEIFEEKDPHFELIQYIFSDKQILDEDKEVYRNLGKKINYAFIYGMNIENLVDTILEDFFTKEDKELLENSIIFEIRDLLKRKIENTEVYEIITKVTNFIKDSSKLNTNVILNYFNRYIHIQKSHALLNNYIQSVAADLLYFKMRMIIDLLNLSNINLDKNKILLQNHDSILLQLETKVIDETDILENILDIMKCSINNLKGFIKFSYGKSWDEI